eukprot:4578572-Prorocentrum_lima.AAC.1
MIVLQRSFQQPTRNLSASLGCYVWTLAAIATTHAMSGLVFGANRCKEPTSMCAVVSSSFYRG